MIGVSLGVYTPSLEHNMLVLAQYLGFLSPYVLALHLKHPAIEQVRQRF